MKTLLLLACLFTTPGGDREQGLQLYREGKFAEAAAAFRAAIEADGDSADLQWNLALASWRARDLAAAETAAEKYAALAKDARVDLHRGMLGAVRFGEAQQLEAEADVLLQGAGAPPTAAGEPDAPPPDPLPVLERALQKAKQARDHFVAGAAAKATPELLRNTERSLRYVDALQQKIDELKQQREQQPQDEPQQPPEDQKPEDEPQEDESQQGEPPKQEPKDGEPQQDGEKPEDGEPSESPPEGEPKDREDGQQGDAEPTDGQPPEPKPEPEDKGEGGETDAPPPENAESEPPSDTQQPDAGKDANGTPPQIDPEDGRRMDAPGEFPQGKELSPEQAKRLLDRLEQLDARLQRLRQGGKTGRRPVERDW